MFARIPIPLNLIAYPSGIDDDAIRKVFKGLGFETRYDAQKIDPATGKIKIGPAGAERYVTIGSNDHHRDLGLRNLGNNPPESIKKEVERFGIFTGSSTQFHSSLFVTRVNEGDITIWCYQDQIEVMLKLCDRIGKHLHSAPLNAIVDIDELRASTGSFSLFSSRSGGLISRGDMSSSRLQDILLSRISDVVLFILTFVLFSSCILMHFVPVEKVGGASGAVVYDPLGHTLRTFVETTWPPSLVALVTLFITLTVAIFSTSRHSVRWAWK